MSMGEAKQSVSEIQEMRDLLENEVSRLIETTTRIEAMLVTVIDDTGRPTAQGPTSPPDAPRFSQIGRFIAEMASQVRQARNRLEFLISTSKL